MSSSPDAIEALPPCMSCGILRWDLVPKPSSLGLCSGVTNAEFATTTEVYPDSPKATDEQCNRAQVACVVGGLEYIIKAKGL